MQYASLTNKMKYIQFLRERVAGLKARNFCRQGQSSLEFVIIVGAMLLFFIIVLMNVSEQREVRAEEERAFLVKDTVISIQQELVLAAGARDGYERTFTLPENVINQAYNVSIIGDLVYLSTENGKHSLALPVPDLNGTLIIGRNTVKKLNGRVLLNLP